MERGAIGLPTLTLLGAMALGGEPRASPLPCVASSPIVHEPAADRIYVANPDADSVTVLRAGGLVKEAEIPCGRDPRSVAVAFLDPPPRSGSNRASDPRDPAGRIRVFATARRGGTVTAFRGAPPFDGRIERRVGVEPWAILWDPAGRTPIATDRAGDAVLWIDPESLEVRRRVEVPALPTALALVGGRLYVGHFHGGRVTVLDASSGRRLGAIALRPGAELIRHFALAPDGTRIFIPHTRCACDAPDLLFDTMIFPFVSILDPAAGRALPGIPIDAVFRPENDPIAAAVTPDGRLLVVHAGSRTLAAIEIETRRAAGRAGLGEIPYGIAVDAGRNRAYVPCLIPSALEAIDLGTWRIVRRAALTRTRLPYRLRRGKALFHDGGSPETTRDRWMSCATCHPDGEAIPRTWRYRAGSRNVPALFGAERTRPLFWSGTRDEIQDFAWAFRHFQAGRGIMPFRPHPALGRPNAGRWPDLDALAAYVASLEPPPSAHLRPDGTYTRAALRGRAIFFRAETGCARCHRPPLYTDSALEPRPWARHDVGTGGDPRERAGPAFDTPTLVGLAFSAPYLHDGRAATLEEVVTTWNRGDRHGRTSHLAPGAIDDLCAFLASIPYVREEDLRPGDVDGDEEVGEADLARLGRFLAGEVSLTEAALQNADLDGDGRIAEMDRRALERRLR